MPRSLLPPRGIFVPTSILYDKSLTPATRDTWNQLRGLAYGQLETPPLSFAQLVELLDKSQSSLYGHMTILRGRGALRWRSARDGTFIVSFPEDDEAANERFQFSKNLEMLDRQLNPVIASDSINHQGQELPTSLAKAIVNEGGTADGVIFQNSGKLKTPARAARDAKPRRKRKAARDERTDHPAIQAIFRLTGRFPSKSQYDGLIETIGDKPDRKKLGLCFREWKKRGYSLANYGWAVDWYINGIPEVRANGRSRHETALDRIARERGET